MLLRDEGPRIGDAVEFCRDARVTDGSLVRVRTELSRKLFG